ncbi:hypothetical protein DXH47_06990 [Levilactobacillus suantsaii]|uniref:Uncharacterized protein n=1 Tax=Levilactobacillus suantsaii TaxID=2292255 RepID=A0A4Q0VIC1_9LACO|nr:hypothetical protein DXH47_06990 [Levilactobacillus suantsaii]
MLSALLFPRKMPAVSVLVDHRASDNDAQAGCRIIFTPGFMPYTIVSPKADGLNDQVVLATVTPHLRQLLAYPMVTALRPWRGRAKIPERVSGLRLS